MKSGFLLLGSLLVGTASAFVVTPYHGVAASGTAHCSAKARRKYKKKTGEHPFEGIKEKFLFSGFDGEAETLSDVIINQLQGKYLRRFAKDSDHQRTLIHLTLISQGPS
jgi:hypothetical protein